MEMPLWLLADTSALSSYLLTGTCSTFPRWHFDFKGTFVKVWEHGRCRCFTPYSIAQIPEMLPLKRSALLCFPMPPSDFLLLDG